MYNDDYLRHSLQRAKDQQKEYLMNENIQVYVKDKISNGIEIGNILDIVNAHLPNHLLREVDSIYVGMFEDFAKKEINATFKDGAIYVSNEQDDEQDLIDDIVHEIAHSLESPFGYLIYGDDKMKQEFLSKRERLFQILKAEGLHPDETLFLEPEYDIKMDNYLYKQVGYDRLNMIVSSYGLYTSAYCATALREYFANGFEYYFLENAEYLSEICPALYKKIEELHYYED